MYSLLFVDDEKLVADSMPSMLRWSDYQLEPPQVAYSYEQATAILAREPVNILISDIEMVGKSGLDLLEWVGAHSSGTLCALLTCHAVFDYAQRGIDLGAIGYLLKPITPEALGAFLRKCVQKLESGDASTAEAKHAVASETLRQVLRYIDEHLDADLSRDVLSKVAYVSRSHLSRLFSKQLGKTVSDYVLERRLHAAKALLRDTDLPITAIAMRTGFCTAAYFSKVFHDAEGRPPLAYRTAKRG